MFVLNLTRENAENLLLTPPGFHEFASVLSFENVSEVVAQRLSADPENRFLDRNVEILTTIAVVS